MSNMVDKLTEVLFNHESNTNGFGFICDSSGQLKYITNGMRELVEYEFDNEINNCNIYNILFKTSNLTPAIITDMQNKIEDGSKVVDIVLKINKCEMFILLSITRLDYHDLFICSGRTVNIPANMGAVLNFGKSSKLSNKISKYKKIDDIKLTDKEQAIVYLLSIGYTQYEIAKFLKYTRGYIGTIIAREICPKFGMVSSSTKLLTKMILCSRLVSNPIPTLVASKLNAFLL